ncbi:MAG: PAS domain S-box protein, partial [Candidatus Marinimicrobia bacterium]|nr:PAS domain S-box protein [Candidatus Neomarinimicrobiota bacterium]
MKTTDNTKKREFKKNYIYFLFIVLSALASYFIINNIYNDKIEDYKKLEIEELQLSYDIIINSYKRPSQIVFNEIINQPEIWNILEDANSNNPEKVSKARQKLLSKLLPTYERLKELDVRHFHFHLPDNKSFLRFHRPSKFGDDLTEVRYSVKMTNSELKPHIGFEEGRIFNGFRYVFPILTSEKKHLGSVEISVNFKVIKKELQKLFPKDYYFLIDKDIVNEKVIASEKSNYKQAFLHDQFMYESYVSISEEVKTINKLIKKQISNALTEFTPVVIDCKCKDGNYIASFYPISNVEGNKSGYIVSYERGNTIEEVKRIYYIVLFSALIFFIIIAVLFFILKRNNQRLKENEKKLVKSEEKFRNLAENMNEILYFIDIKGIVTYISSSVKRIGGYEPSEIIGQHFTNFVYSEDVQGRKDQFQKTKAGIIKESEYRYLTKSGEVLWVKTYPRPIYKNDSLIGIQGILTDITERKKTEEVQRMIYNVTDAINTTKDLDEFYTIIHKQLSTIIDTTNFYIALYNKDKNIISFDYFIDEFVDKKGNINVARKSKKGLTEYVIKTGEPLLADAKAIKKLTKAGKIDGVGTPSKIWLGVPLKVRNTITGVITVQSYTDASLYTKEDIKILEFVSGTIAIAIERKQTEDALKDSEEQYRLIVENAHDGIEI